jgi:DNA-binding GntR family transcriptional regulator
MTSMLSIDGVSAAPLVARGRGARESKVDRAYFALKPAIVSGALAPQILIDKNEWSARFAVSRLSITGAINRLAFERLVVIEPQRGSYVARIRLSDVKQWMLMRRALEMEVVAACAKELSERAIGRLGQNIAYQRAALDSGDLQGFHELDTRFHRQMADGLDLVRVSEVLDPVRTHLERVRRTLLPEPGRMEGTLAEHHAIHSAIAERDVSRAREAMGRHLDRVLRELEAFVVRNPGFFED